MKVRVIGDVHAKFIDYLDIIKDGPEQSIQLGDFGIGFSEFGDGFVHNYLNSLENNNHRFIRGNHDDPEKCKKRIGYIDDGHYDAETSSMFIGGAFSIDWVVRVDGVNWWRDEELSFDRLYSIYDDYVKYKPRFVFTHDAPSMVTKEMMVDSGLCMSKKHMNSKTGSALQSMFETHQPDFWFYGHWHHTKQQNINGTEFICLAELDYVDFDFEAGEIIGKDG